MLLYLLCGQVTTSRVYTVLKLPKCIISSVDTPQAQQRALYSTKIDSAAF